ncbi:MAG TPA: RNA 2',3'-cyclic phosphodiesterase [Geminicoccaceae bacterium]|nr:RNA 2',3'-cyclic phosphodiesterase [Geminicoccaceae bacterium]
MPRLFVALDLPDTAKRQLEPLTGGLALPDVRWLPPEQWHLTLRFIGEVEGGVLYDVGEALAEVPGRPFDLRLKGIGHFPPRGEPKVLWAGVERNAELTALKRRIDRALRDAGLPPDPRRFAPHVSLARFRQLPPPNRLGAYLMRHSLFQGEPFPVSGFRLYSSVLRPDGPVHAVEAEYDLVPGMHGDDEGGW